MAIQPTAFVTVGGNTNPLEKHILEVINKRYTINVGVNNKGNPLGSISKNADQFSESLKAAESRVLAFGAVTGTLYGVISAFKEMLAATLDVEQKLTDINVLLNLSSSELNKFGDSLFSIAKNTGQSFATVSDVAKEFSRQGLGLAETLERTSAALVLVRQSGLDAEGAVAAITSAINSFTKEMNTAAEITNKFAAVDQAFAVSSRDLAEAVSRVGSTAEDAGVNLNQLLGIVTAVQQTTSRGGAVIGNALKTIFTRIGNKEAISQLREFGVDIDNTQSGIVKLQKISEAISLNPEYANEIKRVAGGVYQINIVSAALKDLQNQYGITSQASEKALNAQNEAFERNKRQNETLATTINATKQNLTSLGATLGNDLFGPAIKSIAGGFNELFDTLKNADEGSFIDIGTTVGTGIMKGIGEYIAGPGAILLSVIFGKIAAKLFSFSKKAFSLDSLFADNRYSSPESKTSLAAVQTLQQQPEILKSVLNGTLSIQDAERQILSLMNQQNATLERQRDLIKQISVRVALGSPVIPVPTTVAKAAPVRKASSGYIPQFAEQTEIAGAIEAGYKPGKVKAKHIKGLGKIYYNDAEKVVNFEGMDQPAIIPPYNSKAGKNYKKDFERKLGFDPYKAEGMVPNFAAIPRTILSKKPDGGLLNYSIDNDEARISMISSSGQAGTSKELYPLLKEELNKEGIKKVSGYLNAQNLAPRSKAPVDRLTARFPQLTRGRHFSKNKLTVDNDTFDLAGGPAFDRDLKKKASFILSSIDRGEGNISLDSFLSKGLVPNYSKDFTYLDRGAYAKVYKINEALVGKVFDPVPQAVKMLGGRDKALQSFNETREGLEYARNLAQEQSLPVDIARTYKPGSFSQFDRHRRDAEEFTKKFGSEVYFQDFVKSAPSPELEARTKANELLNAAAKKKRGNQIVGFGDLIHNPKNFLGNTIVDLLAKKNTFSNGLVPNYAENKEYSQGMMPRKIPNYSNLVEYSPAVKEAISREREAGLPFSQIRIGQDTRIKSKNNPQGLGVYNKQDEPLGIKQGVNRAIQEKKDPKVYGTGKAFGFIPNFASESSPRINFNTTGFLKDDLAEIKKAFKEGTANQKDLNSIISKLSVAYGFTEKEIKQYTSNLNKSASYFKEKRGPQSVRGSFNFSQEAESPTPSVKSEGNLLSASELIGKKYGVPQKEEVVNDTRLKTFKDIANIEVKRLNEEEKSNREKIKIALKEADITIKSKTRGRVRPTPQILDSLPNSVSKENVSFGPKDASTAKGKFKIRRGIQILDQVPAPSGASEGTLLSSKEKVNKKLFNADLSKVNSTLLKLAQKTQTGDVNKALDASDKSLKDTFDKLFKGADRRSESQKTSDYVSEKIRASKKEESSTIASNNPPLVNQNRYKNTYTKYYPPSPGYTEEANTLLKRGIDFPLPPVNNIRGKTVNLQRSIDNNQNLVTQSENGNSSVGGPPSIPFGNFGGELGSRSKEAFKEAGKLSSRITNSKFGRISDKIGNGPLGIGLSIGVPAVAGVAQELIGDDTLGKRRANSTISGIANTVSFGTSGALVGSAFGGVGAPAGAAIGITIGAISSLSAAMKEWNNILPDLEKNIQAIDNSSAQVASSLASYINATQQLEAVYSGAASARPAQIQLLEKAREAALKGIKFTPEEINKIKESGKTETVVDIASEKTKKFNEDRSVETARASFFDIRANPEKISSYGIEPKTERKRETLTSLQQSFDTVLSTKTKDGSTFEEFFQKNFASKFNDPKENPKFFGVSTGNGPFELIKKALKEAGIDEKFPELLKLNEGGGIKDSRLNVINKAFTDQITQRQAQRELPPILEGTRKKESTSIEDARNNLESIQRDFSKAYNSAVVDNELTLKKSEGEDQVFKAQKDSALSLESKFLSESEAAAKKFNNELIGINLSFDQLTKKNIADSILKTKDAILSQISDLTDKSNNIANDGNLEAPQQLSILNKTTDTANKSRAIYDSIQSPEDINPAIEDFRKLLKESQVAGANTQVGSGQLKFYKSQEKTFQNLISELESVKNNADKLTVSLVEQQTAQGRVFTIQRDGIQALIEQSKNLLSFGGLGGAPRVTSASNSLFNLKKDLDSSAKTGDFNSQVEALNKIAQVYKDLGLDLPKRIRSELESIEFKSIQQQIKQGIRPPITNGDAKKLAVERVSETFKPGQGPIPLKELGGFQQLEFNVADQIRNRPEAFSRVASQDETINKLKETQVRLNKELEARTIDILTAQKEYTTEVEKQLSIQEQFGEYFVKLKSGVDSLRDQADLFDTVVEREKFINSTELIRIGYQKRINDGTEDGLKAQRQYTYELAKQVSLQAEAAFNAGRVGSEVLKTADAAKRAAELENTGKLKGRSIGEAFGDQFKNNNIDNFKALNDAAVDFGQEFKNGIKGAFAEFQDGTKSAKEAIVDLGLSLARSLGQKAFNIGIDNILGATLGNIKFAKGGPVKGYSSGGVVTGGSGTKDDVPALLTDGEYVIKKNAVKTYGIDFLESVNDKRIAYDGETTAVKSGSGSFNGVFKNTIKLDDPVRPTKGTTLTDENLSSFALEDDNNPQNTFRNKREELLTNYIRNNKRLLEEYNKKKNNALNGALIQAGISLVGVGVGAAAGSFAGRTSSGTSVAGATGNALSSSPYATGLSYNQSGVGGGTTFNPSVPVSQSGYGSYTNFNYSQIGAGSKYDPSQFRFRNKGGPIKFAKGGGVFGGDSYSDRIPALLTDGEFVITKDASRKYGRDFLDKLNDQKITKFADGGPVSTQYAGSSNISLPFDELVNSLTALKKTMEDLVENSKSTEVSKPSGGASNPQFNIVINNSITQDKSGKVTSTSTTSSSSKDDNSDNSKNSKEENQKQSDQLKALGERMKNMARVVIAEELRPGGALENVNRS